ncbi:unnamed protein product [Pieris brassicae]|uniref:Uncharacterized protein n=1 Tax=Pieris brassicae TaxID=7116 RepID=A0A9P0TR69_PIEBR|nr:unnamed protein product [Pieris brassicae]
MPTDDRLHELEHKLDSIVWVVICVRQPGLSAKEERQAPLIAIKLINQLPELNSILNRVVYVELKPCIEFQHVLFNTIKQIYMGWRLFTALLENFVGR